MTVMSPSPMRVVRSVIPCKYGPLKHFNHRGEPAGCFGTLQWGGTGYGQRTLSLLQSEPASSSFSTNSGEIAYITSSS